jgi:HK97 family phage prohead protease
MKYDFAGWATKANILCTDGRTIMKDAFKDQNGATVPLVWGHNHDDPLAVLGHALLENRPEGVWAYGTFNDTEAGRAAKILVDHGDVDALSICAGKLTEDKRGQVHHGKIREVSLVLAGANEGARIETIMSHDDTGEFEAYIFNDEFELEINHEGKKLPVIETVDAEEAAPEETPEIAHEDKKGAEEVATEEKKTEKTVKDVIDTMNEEQKNVLIALVNEAMALEPEDEEKTEKSKEDTNVKHNVFDTDQKASRGVLTHSDFEAIKTDAKRLGSWRDAFNAYTESMLKHDDEPAEVSYETSPGTATYGIDGVEWLFPDAHLVDSTPRFIQRDMGWVRVVMDGCHHSPFSRIKSMFANITADDARAKGYVKGNQKLEEFFTLIRRTTTPQTIYKKQKMDRDDVIDITDFDVIAWLRSEMRMMLDEEIARAVLIGDGRSPAAEDKIMPDHIRPIASDDPLFTIRAQLDPNETGVRAKINALIRARKYYKGKGNPILFTTEDFVTEALLLTDDIGRDLYEDIDKLNKKLRVSRTVTVPVMENSGFDCIVVNLQDYTIGADKGGKVSMFEDFDIDVNQQKYLIETRCSGALTAPFSAIVLEGESGNTESIAGPALDEGSQQHTT